jgi:hypothetical protein
MPCHYWGEEDFDWEGLDKAINFIDKNLVKWGRVNIRQSKEKYGTARIYCSLGWYQFHSITHPRACLNRYPKWLWVLDCDYGSKIVRLLNWIIFPYHKWLYKTVYYIACKRYPHLENEICCCADFVELLKFYKK